MPEPAGQPEKFPVEELPGEGRAVLRARTAKLMTEDLEAFRRACCSLLGSAMARLEVDLSRVESLFTVYVGVLADLTGVAREKGKSLAVLARPRVAEVFERMKMEEIVALQVVKPSDA
jgi:anti-anti-sigma regulatory factor